MPMPRIEHAVVHHAHHDAPITAPKHLANRRPMPDAPPMIAGGDQTSSSKPGAAFGVAV